MDAFLIRQLAFRGGGMRRSARVGAYGCKLESVALAGTRVAKLASTAPPSDQFGNARGGNSDDAGGDTFFVRWLVVDGSRALFRGLCVAIFRPRH